MTYYERAIALLPDRLRDAGWAMRGEQVEELRLRAGRAATALVAGREVALGAERVSQADILRALEKATGASLHAYADELRAGYISYGGLRLGLCGTAIIKNGDVHAFRSFSSLAIRIPAELSGRFEGVYSGIASAPGAPGVLIISPPGGGKTTALRELIRRMSNDGRRVAVVDERNELAAADITGAGFDLGARTDVLTGVKKSRGAIMLLRAMNPEYIAVDEITDAADIAAMREITGCGVGIIATAHATDAAALPQRELYRELLSARIFDYAIEIRRRGGEREYTLKRLNA